MCAIASPPETQDEWPAELHNCITPRCMVRRNSPKCTCCAAVRKGRQAGVSAYTAASHHAQSAAKETSTHCSMSSAQAHKCGTALLLNTLPFIKSIKSKTPDHNVHQHHHHDQHHHHVEFNIHSCSTCYDESLSLCCTANHTSPMTGVC